VDEERPGISTFPFELRAKLFPGSAGFRVPIQIIETTIKLLFLGVRNGQGSGVGRNGLPDLLHKTDSVLNGHLQDFVQDSRAHEWILRRKTRSQAA
jgi:hypothetical protein